MYFKNFPNIEYRFSDIRTINMVDIFRSVKFTKKTLDSVEIFETFTLTDGDTPERVADQVYGDVRLYWLVLLANDIINPTTEWPNSTRTEGELFSQNYDGYAIYFDHELDIKQGDYIAKRDASATAGVSDQFGVVNSYNSTLNKIEIVNHNFTSLTTGTGVGLDLFYVFRETSKDRFLTLTTNLDSSGNDYHQPKRVDKLADSVVYFKDAGRVISPLTAFRSGSYSPTGDLLYSTTGKKSGNDTVIKKYHDGDDSTLVDNGIQIVTYNNELPSNVLPSIQIKVLRSEFVSSVVNEIEKLLNDKASDGTRSILSFGSNTYGA